MNKRLITLIHVHLGVLLVLIVQMLKWVLAVKMFLHLQLVFMQLCQLYINNTSNITTSNKVFMVCYLILSNCPISISL